MGERHVGPRGDLDRRGGGDRPVGVRALLLRPDGSPSPARRESVGAVLVVRPADAPGPGVPAARASELRGVRHPGGGAHAARRPAGGGVAREGRPEQVRDPAALVAHASMRSYGAPMAARPTPEHSPPGARSLPCTPTSPNESTPHCARPASFPCAGTTPSSPSTRRRAAVSGWPSWLGPPCSVAAVSRGWWIGWRRAGLLTREPSEDDARGAYAVLTPQGLQALRRCWSVYGREIDRLIGRRLTSADARRVAAQLGELLERPAAGEA